MLDKIIKFSLSNRLFILLGAVVVVVVGLFTARQAEIDVFPDLNAPTVVVMTEATGMAAEEVEQLVTYPIETAMNGAAGVRRVRSQSSNGFSVVWVEFDWDTEVYRARQIVAEKLSEVQGSLPEGIGSPVMGPQSSILGEMMIISLTSDTVSMMDLRTLAESVVRPRLLGLGGVAQVSVIGGDLKQYQILLSPEKMRHYGVSLEEVMTATRGMNKNSNGGVVYQYGNEYIVRGVNQGDVVSRLSRGVIKKINGYPVTLADVAEVKTGAQSPKLGVASEKGNESVILTVTKQPGAGTMELTEKIDESLASIEASLPKGVHVSTDIFRQSDFIENAIDNVETSLLEGAFFVVIILFLFLANVRTTLISLITIPLSLLITIIVIRFFGYSINTMSLGGMAIAIGSLVDDAIVDVENVWKHLRRNASLPKESRRGIKEVVFEASREVRTPILNSTFIIVVSFIPLFFLQGIEGRMLVPLGVAFIVALFASTLVALTLTPVMCSYLLKHKGIEKEVEKEPAITRWLRDKYRRSLEWVLRRKKQVVIATGGLLVLSIVLFCTLGSSFLPGFNEGSFTINVSTLPGVSLEESEAIGIRAQKLIMEVPEIKTVACKTGRAELDEHALGVNVSEIEAPFELKDRTHEEVVADLRSKLSTLSGVNIEIGQPISHRIDAMLSGSQAKIAIKLFGDDLNALFTKGNEIKEAIEDVKGIADVNVEQQIERPEIKITPRPEMLARYGITEPAFNEYISVMLGGETVSQVYEGSRSYDLVVKTDDSHRKGIEEIRRMLIDSGDSIKIPLADIADVVSAAGPNTINRENVKRKIVVSANTHGRDLGSVVGDIQKRVKEKVDIPQGYYVEYGGQFESEQRASRMLLLASLGSVLVIFLLLYMEFKSARESLVILLNLPFALIGGVLVLRFSSGEVSIPAIIGFISLFGIATRNGMLLIAKYNNFYIADGYSLRKSVIEGSVDRMNPILMTAMTSALALIPLAMRGDLPGNEIQAPMASVILGGLVTSTFLNFYIIPIVYEWLHRKGRPEEKHLDLRKDEE